MSGDGLSREFAHLRADAWMRLQRRFELEDDLPPMEDVIQRIQEFLMPVLKAIVGGKSVNKYWAADTGWRREDERG